MREPIFWSGVLGRVGGRGGSMRVVEWLASWKVLEENARGIE